MKASIIHADKEKFVAIIQDGGVSFFDQAGSPFFSIRIKNLDLKSKIYGKNEGLESESEDVLLTCEVLDTAINVQSGMKHEFGEDAGVEGLDQLQTFLVYEVFQNMADGLVDEII